MGVLESGVKRYIQKRCLDLLRRYGSGRHVEALENVALNHEINEDALKKTLDALRRRAQR